MTQSKMILVLLVSSWLLGPVVRGITDDQGAAERDYQVFVERNPFGLKPPPPPPTNAPVADKPKDEILLTGITSIGGARAYFMSKAPQGKSPEYYSLGPDEKKNGLEVLEINTVAKSVRVRNAGVENVMTFASNGVKPPAAPATPTPATPGMPAPPGVAALPGGGATVTTPNMGMPGGQSLPANASGPGRVRAIPTRNSRTPTMGGNAAGDPPLPAALQQPARPDPNAAVQDVLMMELQKRANPNIQYPPTPMPQ